MKMKFLAIAAIALVATACAKSDPEPGKAPKMEATEEVEEVAITTQGDENTTTDNAVVDQANGLIDKVADKVVDKVPAAAQGAVKNAADQAKKAVNDNADKLVESAKDAVGDAAAKALKNL